MKKSLLMAAALTLGLALCSLAQAKETTITGSLVDSYCYATMGAHGASHQACALKCAKAGIPVSLLASGSNKLYVLLPAKNAEPMPSSVIDNMEKQVTITGDTYSKGGVNFLTVKALK